ncbi:hypothetical protein [Vibrio pelagius]|uniref:hypothetical protein n=1 Tax=Vibrio pelagius TaxID=28169 RepID=UPI0021C32A53|nr:hypothetical protein [Vibrio pelagius]
MDILLLPIIFAFKLLPYTFAFVVFVYLPVVFLLKVFTKDRNSPAGIKKTTSYPKNDLQSKPDIARQGSKHNEASHSALEDRAKRAAIEIKKLELDKGEELHIDEISAIATKYGVHYYDVLQEMD